MLNEGELARRINGQIEVRSSGLRVRWDLPQLITSDGHEARGVFSCTVQPLQQAVEREMLEEALLASRSVVTTADVASHFAPSLLAAAGNLCQSDRIENLISESGRKRITDALLQAGKSIAFSCGVELLAPFELNLDCPSLNQAQTIKRKSAEQVEQLRRAGDLFAQFQSIRSAAPELSAAQVLDRLGIADQADLLRSVLLASAGNAATSNLYAVAGNSLVEITGAESSSPRVMHVPEILGPLRSVQAASDGNLLLGCRSGVMKFHPEKPDEFTAYRAPQIASQLGFNAAVVAGNRIWATHGEAGVIAWNLAEPDRPQLALRREGADFPARNLMPANSDLILSAKTQIYRVRGDDPLQALGSAGSSDIAAIVIDEGLIVSLHDDGLICARRMEDGAIHSQRRVARISAAVAMPWLGDQRLLLATEDGPILATGLKDDLIAQYTSVYRACRIVAASARTIAAVTGDRQRLILWHAWDGRKPFSEIHVALLTQHRIADIAFV